MNLKKVKIKLDSSDVQYQDRPGDYQLLDSTQSVIGCPEYT
jgi:hypothetical protein